MALSDTENKTKKSITAGIKDYFEVHKEEARGLLDSAAIIVLCLYPFRNIHSGLDLWDTGYNYSNFEYMGLKSMDPMWLFSTYLANAIGHLLSLLPYGHTLLGMNFYTAFFPALMAFMVYIFLTRKLKAPIWLAFLSQFAALSMCWAPTGVLYQYLTYLVITFSCLLLYRGLTEKEPVTVALSGAVCSLGIFVRFSNLPHASLILAIWMYGFFEFADAHRDGDSVKRPSRIEFLRKSIFRGVWFLAGYAAAFIVFFIYLGIRYGFADYLSGISQLFDMSQNAEGYSAKAMLFKLAKSYFDQLYWVIRLMFFAVIGGGLNVLADYLNERFIKSKAADKGTGRAERLLVILVKVLGVLLGVDAVLFLILRRQPFVTFIYTSYWCVFALAGLLCFSTLIAALIVIFMKNSTASDRLLAVLAVYALLISAIGGNNGSYSSFNNMFIWLPFLLISVRKLIADNKYNWTYGLKCTLFAVITFFYIQSTLFGFNFAFAEGENGAQIERTMTALGMDSLDGIRMSEEKARSISALNYFLTDSRLKDRELITYGYIPGIHFYLQMKPAFNAWPDLDSFTSAKMTEALAGVSRQIREAEINKEMAEPGYEKPVIIICVSDNALGSDDEVKWKLIYDFIEHEDYRLTYTDSIFAVYE